MTAVINGGGTTVLPSALTVQCCGCRQTFTIAVKLTDALLRKENSLSDKSCNSVKAIGTSCCKSNAPDSDG
jgi:hypothetical protein